VHEGLLRHTTHRGAFVPRLTSADIRDITVMRQALEAEAVRLVTTSAGQLDALQSVVDLTAATRAKDRERVIDLDLQFHHSLIEASGSPQLARAFGSLESEIRLSFAQQGRLYDKPSVIAEQHAELLDVIRKGNADKAVRAMRNHLDAALLEMEDGARNRNGRRS
jgi:DNA-binding GntR family transcriptional regulator